MVHEIMRQLLRTSAFGREQWEKVRRASKVMQAESVSKAAVAQGHEGSSMEPKTRGQKRLLEDHSKACESGSASKWEKAEG